MALSSETPIQWQLGKMSTSSAWKRATIEVKSCILDDIASQLFQQKQSNGVKVSLDERVAFWSRFIHVRNFVNNIFLKVFFIHSKES
jgi:hypothetical protein